MSQEDEMIASWKIHEFAELAGVTVKALHHYDRLGLLKPQRTDAGYRVYTMHDLERLEQIVALKFLGLPLKQIAVLLDRSAIALADALGLQRRALEEKQRRLAGAITAIIEAEKSIRPGEPPDAAVLKRLIQAIEIQQVDLAQYYSEETLEKIRQFCERAASSELVEKWTTLRRDVVAAIGQDPAGETGQALAIRWRALEAESSGLFNWVSDPAVVADFKKIKEKGGPDLPPGLRRRFEESGVGQAVPFILKAMAALPKER